VKTVFELEGWKVIEQDNAYWNMDYDIVTHGCSGWWTRDRVQHAWDMMNRTHCKGCGEQIPDGVIGVWKLRNMDSIARDVDAPAFYRSAFEYEAPKSI
jgi:hypothetical protein